MTLTFDGDEIPGTHGPVLAAAPELQTARTKFMGVVGESEVVGGTGSCVIETHIWLHDEYEDSAALQAYLSTLRKLRGTHGSLVVSGTVAWTYQGCTFEGFSPHERGPLPDPVGSLDGGWWIEGTLRWTQLSVALDEAPL